MKIKNHSSGRAGIICGLSKSHPNRTHENSPRNQKRRIEVGIISCNIHPVVFSTTHSSPSRVVPVPTKRGAFLYALFTSASARAKHFWETVSLAPRDVVPSQGVSRGSTCIPCRRPKARRVSKGRSRLPDRNEIAIKKNRRTRSVEWTLPPV